MSNRWVETDRFRAKTGTGEMVTVVAETNHISNPVLGGGTAHAVGRKRLITTDGRHVNLVGPNQYAFPDGTPLTRL